MMYLWMRHIMLTQNTVYAAKFKSPEFESTLSSLLDNQVDLGKNWALFFGTKSGKKYAELLTTHINQAVAVVSAALEGKNIDPLVKVWYGNGAEIASFLSQQTGIKEERVRKLFFEHISCLIREVQAILSDNYASSNIEFQACLDHARRLVLLLAKGIGRCKK